MVNCFLSLSPADDQSSTGQSPKLLWTLQSKDEGNQGSPGFWVVTEFLKIKPATQMKIDLRGNTNNNNK